jgi:hypothetical protein
MINQSLFRRQTPGDGMATPKPETNSWIQMFVFFFVSRASFGISPLFPIRGNPGVARGFPYGTPVVRNDRRACEKRRAAA